MNGLEFGLLRSLSVKSHGKSLLLGQLNSSQCAKPARRTVVFSLLKFISSSPVHLKTLSRNHLRGSMLKCYCPTVCWFFSLVNLWAWYRWSSSSYRVWMTVMWTRTAPLHSTSTWYRRGPQVNIWGWGVGGQWSVPYVETGRFALVKMVSDSQYQQALSWRHTIFKWHWYMYPPLDMHIPVTWCTCA